MQFVKILLFVALAWFSVAANAVYYNNTTCGINSPKLLTNPYGPYDYINPEHQHKLPIVLQYHFTIDIQRLLPGKNHSGDLGYTLKAIPNFHPALYAVSQYEKRNLLKETYTAECFLKRAVYFQPKDSTSMMLYAMYLADKKRNEEADEMYQRAIKISPVAAELNYNYGLFLVDQGDFAKAQKAADIAYKKGYPMMGLKNKLTKHKKSAQTKQ